MPGTSRGTGPSHYPPEPGTVNPHAAIASVIARTLPAPAPTRAAGGHHAASYVAFVADPRVPGAAAAVPGAPLAAPPRANAREGWHYVRLTPGQDSAGTALPPPPRPVVLHACI